MSGANILIISDLHLGEDIKPPHDGKTGKTQVTTGYLRNAILLERELEAFLRHYTERRLDGRPWKLVVNGDMVDFLSVCLLPHQQEELPPQEVSGEDRVFGLGTRPLAARIKMVRVLRRHDKVFRALAEFIAAGNHLEIVVGNHDVEFHWPLVQETFRQGISALVPDETKRGQVTEAITFHPWFFFEENVAWVEHGHQYDDFCSFDYVLSPVSPDDGEIVPSLGAAGLRYVLNHAGYVEGQELWGFSRQLRWSLAKGIGGLGGLARGFLHMVWRMFAVWRLYARRPEVAKVRRRQHLERLGELAAQFKLGEDTLIAVDNLRREPIPANLFRLLMALMLDRLAVLAATTVCALVFVVAFPWAWALAAVGGALAVAGGLSVVLKKARGEVDPAARLREAPERIRRFVRAPFVVFGHTHDPAFIPLKDGGWYLNTGTWAGSGKSSFTHVVIRRAEGGLRAALCQWRNGESREFAVAHPERVV